jgi:hypothetical protein
MKPPIVGPEMDPLRWTASSVVETSLVPESLATSDAVEYNTAPHHADSIEIDAEQDLSTLNFVIRLTGIRLDFPARFRVYFSVVLRIDVLVAFAAAISLGALHCFSILMILRHFL